MKEGPASVERDGAARLLDAARESLAEGRGETVSVKELLSFARVTRPVLYKPLRIQDAAPSRRGLEPHRPGRDRSLAGRSARGFVRRANLPSLPRPGDALTRPFSRVRSRAIAIVERLVAGGVASGAFENVDIQGAALSHVGAAAAAPAVSVHTFPSTADEIDSAVALVFRDLCRNPKGALPSDRKAISDSPSFDSDDSIQKI